MMAPLEGWYFSDAGNPEGRGDLHGGTSMIAIRNGGSKPVPDYGGNQGE